MNPERSQKHSIDTLFSFLLFGLFVLFLLVLLLFSAQLYQSSVHSLNENQNLHTAATYLTTKFRQHDSAESKYTSRLENLDALCFEDMLGDSSCTTYIYLLDGELKELFTLSDSSLPPEAGVTIAELSGFDFEETPDGYLHILLTDKDGHSSSLSLHPGTPDLS